MPDSVCFYEPLGGDCFRTTVATESPWGVGQQHGGPPAALLARAVQRCEPRDDLAVVRISVEFLGGLPQGELQTSARVVRPGRRVEMVDAVLSAAGREVALARAWRTSTQPGRSPAAGRHDLPPPLPGPQPQRYFPSVAPDWGYGRAVEWRFVTGGYDRPGRAQVWARVRHPLVAGEQPTPLERLLVVADSANGLSAELDLGSWLFVPSSVTVTLHRHPDSDWLYLDARSVVGTAGMGLAHAELSDDRGPLGVVTQPLLVAPRTTG